MIPFGLLAGFMDEKEIRITELAEEGFRFRLSDKAVRPKSFCVCFYDMERATYKKICLQDYKLIETVDENGKPGQPENEITESFWGPQGQEKRLETPSPIYSPAIPGNSRNHSKLYETGLPQLYHSRSGADPISAKSGN